MKKNWSLVIIGAGPAGMSAAIEARKHGLDVLVLDRQSAPGGLIFHSAGKAAQNKLSALGADYARGQKLVQEFLACQAEFLSEVKVWHILPGQVFFSHKGQSHCIHCKEIIIATGGMERPVPLPGWTLPGVMGAGAADVLLKSASLMPDGSVILCGNGPLILQTVVHLKHFNIPIAGVVLTGDIKNTLYAMPKFFGALARPLYMLKGLGMGLKMLLGAPCYFAAKEPVISKTPEGFTLSFQSTGKKRIIKGQTVLLHEGVVSESRITRLARLPHIWNAEQRYWHAHANIWGETGVSGIRCAGDVAGVKGADAAMILGKLAALDTCQACGLIQADKKDMLAKPAISKLKRFQAVQPFMDRVFAPKPEHLLPADKSIVCRCEELTAEELRKHILEGSYSPDGLKAQARPGMGTCQGRMCAAPVAEMIAAAHNISLDKLDHYHAQPPLTPLNFGELAQMQIQQQGGQ